MLFSRNGECPGYVGRKAGKVNKVNKVNLGEKHKTGFIKSNLNCVGAIYYLNETQLIFTTS